MPLITIISINFNNHTGLEKTISSVVSQNVKNIEYIVVDGASTDDSIKVIAENEEFITFWKSERDHGIYDAMNKGIQRATGDYLMFLNSGDFFYDSFILERCIVTMTENPGEDIYYGDIYGEKDNSTETWVHTHPAKLDISFWQYSNINHQSAFIKANLFRTFGFYPEQYKLAGDHWFFLKCFLYHKKFFHISLPIVVYNYSGASISNRKKYFDEMQEIWSSLVPPHLRELVENSRRQNAILEKRFVRKAVLFENWVDKVKSFLKSAKRKFK